MDFLFGNQPVAVLVPLAVAIPGLSFDLLSNPRGLIFSVSEMNSKGAGDKEMNNESPLSPYLLSQICSVVGGGEVHQESHKVLSSILPELSPIKEP